MTIRLDPATDKVWRLTEAARVASLSVKPTLRIRCDRCRIVVAQAANVPGHGPFLTSSWPVPRVFGPLDMTGEQITVRQALRHADRFGASVETSHPDHLHGDDIDGMWALLSLPAGVPDDYPDLFVRCADHGNAVLDRERVVRALRDARVKDVAVAMAPGPPPSSDTRREPLTDGATTTRRTFTIRYYATEDQHGTPKTS